MAPWCLLESHINRDRAWAHRYYTKHTLSLPRRGSKSLSKSMTRVRRARLRFWSLHFLSEYHTVELLSQFSLSFKAQSFFFFLTLSGDMTDSIHPSLAYIKTTKKAPYLKILPSRAQIRLWPIYVLLSFLFSNSYLFFVSFVTNLILYQPGVSFNTWLFLFHLFLVTISKMWNQLFF